MNLPSPKRNNRLFGQSGEDFAVDLLHRSGYKIIDRNFHSRFGEIDIIALDKDTLVFVEVKTRWSNKFGNPLEAVTPIKLYRIKKTADYYSLLHPDLPKKLRIDVVAIEIDKGKVLSAKIVKVD